jgi:hypothetical protein
MWPFRSKTQKKLDALQELVNARRRVLAAAAEIFDRASVEFERLEQSLSDEEWKAFILAQGQYGFSFNALHDDVSRAEESIQELRTASDFVNGREPMQLAGELIETERRLVRTEQTCRSLGAACGRMVEITGLQN